MKFTTEGAREENARWTDKDEQMHGPNQNIETYYDDAGSENQIECTNSEREDFERDSGMELTEDVLNAQTFCTFRQWLKDNYELKSDEEIDEADQNLKNELEARRADAKQLERMVNTINAAMPHFRSAMGSECDHAEIALAALIKERDEFKALLVRIVDAHGDYFTDAPECAENVLILETAILDADKFLNPEQKAAQ